jgi:hypothetical protein
MVREWVQATVRADIPALWVGSGWEATPDTRGPRAQLHVHVKAFEVVWRVYVRNSQQMISEPMHVLFLAFVE